MVRAGYENASRVQQIFKSRSLTPSDVATLEDLERLPVISREQVAEYERQAPPFGGFARKDLTFERIFTSPGPIYEPHLTESSLWTAGYHAAGFTEGDVVLNTFSYHLVAAGLTFHEGLRACGATVVPSGTSNTEIQVQLLKDLGVTGFVGTPSFLKAIIAKAEEKGLDIAKDFYLRKASFVAEPLEPSLRTIFEERYGIDTYQMYGATEVGDIAFECAEKKGWHIVEDAVVEIVDPDTGRSMKEGTLGEVVVTRLNNIFFLFRFGTGDLSSIIEEQCPCGRTSLRLSGIHGRCGDAVKIRGLFIAPSQLNNIKKHFKNIKYQLVIDRKSFKDYLTVALEGPTIDDMIVKSFTDRFATECTVRIDEISIVSPGSIADSAPLIVDRRSWD